MLKFNVSVATLSINDKINFSEKIKQGFKRRTFGTNTDLK